MTRLTERDGIQILIHKHDETCRQKWYSTPNTQTWCDWHPRNTWILHPMYAFNAWTLSTHESFQPMHCLFPWIPSTHLPFQPINAFSTWTPQSIHPFNTWTLSTRESFQPRHDFNTSVFQPVHRPSLWILPFIQCILPFNSSFQRIPFKMFSDSKDTLTKLMW